jgi:hypothetical protein
MSFLVNIIIVKAYSPLDKSTKLTSNNYVIQTWTKGYNHNKRSQGPSHVQEPNNN